VARAPYQVLVFPYRLTKEGDWEFAIFLRADGDFWQGISGGGEGDERPLEAARRELFEETCISTDAPLLGLDTTASIRVTWFRDSPLWGKDRLVVPEYAYGVRVDDIELVLSDEHSEMRWLPYRVAEHLLRFDSNRTALWELNLRIRGLGPRDIGSH
jgi:dihydroneopterin triphosphate diphosphatase